MNPGDTFDGSKTTLEELVDMVFTNRSPNLASKDMTWTAIDPVTVQGTWPDNSQDLVRFKIEHRSVPPEWIEL